MQAIETTGKVDERGQIQLDQPLNQAVRQRVRVIVLISDSDGEIDDVTWRKSAASNPSFSFLQDPEEDIYTLDDGKPVSHEG